MKEFIQKAKAFLFKSRLRTGIVIVVIAAVLFFGWKSFGAKSQTPQYQTAQAQKETLVSSVSESGQVAVANRVAVTTGANGIVAHVYVKSGDTIKQGDTIADLTLDISGQQKQAQAWANYLSAKSSLDSANATLYSLQSTMFTKWQTFTNLATNTTYQNADGSPNTSTRVAPQFASPQDDWLAAEAAYKNQQGVIAQAQAAVTNTLLAYDALSSNIIAPTNGTITDLTIAPGMQLGGAEVSGGSSGTTLATVANIKSEGTPTISVNLSEVDAAKVQTGDKATITFDALPNQTFTGKVIGINTTGTVTSGVTSYPTTIVLDSGDDRILPNMSVTANIITGIKDNVLAIPTAAIQSSGGQSTVQVLKNGQLTPTTVVTGATSATDTEIVSGLNEGETVVVGFVPTTTGGATGSSPFSSGNPFRGIGGFGGGGGGRGGAGGGGARGG